MGQVAQVPVAAEQTQAVWGKELGTYPTTLCPLPCLCYAADTPSPLTPSLFLCTAANNLLQTAILTSSSWAQGPVTFLVFSLTRSCEKPLSPLTRWPLVAGTRVVWHLARQGPALPAAELPSWTEGGPHEQVPSDSAGLARTRTLLAGTRHQHRLERARNGLP